MYIYILAVVAAALLQIATIYYLRANFLGSFLYAIPFILAYQFLFLWSYSKAPNFLVIWFTTTALTNALAFLVGYFLYQEQMPFWSFAGIVLIVVGVALLNVGKF